MIIKKRQENIRIYLCFILFLCASLTATAAEVPARADSLVMAGNKHYMDHDYVNAIDCYTRVIDMGYSASSLYFNLGNAWYNRIIFQKQSYTMKKPDSWIPRTRISGKTWS